MSMENCAFIDSQNLVRGIKRLVWRLGFRRFRGLLRNKYHNKHAYWFVGFVAENQPLYDALQAAGFRLVFKEVSCAGEGIKGNVDVDLAIRAVDRCLREAFDTAYLITSDGDYAGLVRYLADHQRFGGILSAERKTCSYLLRKAAKGKISYLDEFSHKIDLK